MTSDYERLSFDYMAEFRKDPKNENLYPWVAARLGFLEGIKISLQQDEDFDLACSIENVELTAKLKAAEIIMRSWAYLGYNGSPFPDKERQELVGRYAKQHFEEFKSIFNEDP